MIKSKTSAQILVALGHLVVPQSAFSAPLPIQDFIQIYLRKDPQLELENSRLTRAEGRHEISSDLFQSKLILTPAYTRQEQSYSPSNLNFKDSAYELAAELTQDTPLGLQLKLKGTKSASWHFGFKEKLSNQG